MNTNSKHFAFIASTIIYLVAFGLFLYPILILTDNNFTYGLDDTYIHMAIAENLATNGTWGIRAGEFVSASSSPLWIAILAFIRLMVSHTTFLYAPLALNVICQVATIYVLSLLYKNYFKNPLHTLIAIIITAYVSNFIFIVYEGMEHSLQLFLISLFIYLSSEKKSDLSQYITAALIVACRYDNALFVGIYAAYRFYKKDYKFSITLVLSSLSLIIVFGVYSLLNGMYFIPNSIVVRYITEDNSFDDLNSYVKKILHNYLFIASFITATINLLLAHKNRNYANIVLLPQVIICIIASSIVYSIGFFPTRYEMYMYVSYMIFICSRLEDKSSLIRKFNYISLTILVLATNNLRYGRIIHQSQNIYEQQINTSKLISEYYPDKEIALNDIGTTAYFTKANIIDMIGLSDNNFKKIIEENLPKNIKKFYEEMNRQISTDKPSLIIRYDSWLTDDPSTYSYPYQKVATMTINNNYVCGDSTITIYAPKNEHKQAINKIEMFLNTDKQRTLSYKLFR